MVGVTVLFADGDAALNGVGVRKIIFIAPSSGTGDSTFLPVNNIPTMMRIIRKNPNTIPVAATVLVRSSINKVYHVVNP